MKLLLLQIIDTKNGQKSFLGKEKKFRNPFFYHIKIKGYYLKTKAT